MRRCELSIFIFCYWTTGSWSYMLYRWGEGFKWYSFCSLLSNYEYLLNTILFYF